MPRPAPPRRAAHAGVLLIATAGAATLGAPAASAMVDPTTSHEQQVAAPSGTRLLDNGPVFYLGTPEEPVTIGVGALILYVGEEPGNEVGGPVDLSGATIRVTFTTSPTADGADDEVDTCTTDEWGACVFADADGEYELSPLPGDVVVVEQLTPPTSGLFSLPAPDDRVVHAVAAVDTTVPGGFDPDAAPWDEVGRADPLPVVVDRVAPDVLGGRNDWTQIVFSDPLTTGGETASGDTAPGAPAPDGPVAGTSTAGTAGGAAPSATSTTAGADPGSTTTAAAPGAMAATAPAAAATPATASAQTSSGRDLATTGADLGPVLGLGGVLLLAGGGALLAARRRSA